MEVWSNNRKKEIDQYFIKITDYAEKLLENIQELDGWPNQVKLMQENWIGKSLGLDIARRLPRTVSLKLRA